MVEITAKSADLQIAEFRSADIAEFTRALVATTRRFGDTHPWWRGQRDAEWRLTARLHRDGREKSETNLNAQYLLKAKARRSDCPDDDDPLGWLFLMQHYRLPTRLLDWTQSPLVALYFALERPDDVDAAIWALAPTELNLVEANTKSICMPGSNTIGRLGLQAFRVGAEARDQRVLSVYAKEADIRHLVQQPAFTLHGRSQPLEDMPAAGRFLARIRIPATAKKGLRQVLRLFGVSQATVFPDLENLAAYLSGLNFAVPMVVEATDPAPNVAP